MSPFTTSFANARFAVPVRLRWMLLGWVAAEFLVFLLLVRLIGLGGTILLGLATTVLGAVLLRRAGADALAALRRGAGSMGVSFSGDGAMLDGLLGALGALLLIVPGFLANAAGLVLAAPSGRRSVVRRFSGAAGPAGPRVRAASRPGVIDLDPADWRQVDRH